MKKTKLKSNPTPAAGKIAVLEIRRMALAECLPHERNPRQHPEPGTPQWETLKASLAHDYFDPLCWNKRNGKLVSGHLRRKVLLAEGYTQADVSVVDYDEPTHIARMIAANKLQGLDDLPILKDLLAEIDTGALDMNLTGWNENELEGLITAAPPEEVDQTGIEKGIYAFREDVIFQCKNKFGIPELLTEKLSQKIPKFVWTVGETQNIAESLFLFGTNTFPQDAGAGVLGFYVDDYRFESVWNDAVRIMDAFCLKKWSAIISPDFSLWRDAPLAIQLFNIYRSRWCARYWQEGGFEIIPSLNWSDERSYEFAFLGIPTDAPVVSVQCRTTRSKKGEAFFIKGLSAAIEVLRPQNVIIYGGMQHSFLLKQLPEVTTYHLIDSWTNVRHTKRKGVI